MPKFRTEPNIRFTEVLDLEKVRIVQGKTETIRVKRRSENRIAFIYYLIYLKSIIYCVGTYIISSSKKKKSPINY